MTALRDAVLDAKYIDLISLGDFLAAEAARAATSNAPLGPAEMADAVFRWAVSEVRE